MRDLKFRAWDKQENEWAYYTITPGKRSESVFHEDYEEYFLFTGLHDKNGKEIYEGDIVRKEWWEGDVQTTHIVWLDGGFTYAATRYDYNGLLDPGEWEVIGNIHETPELVK